MHAASRKLVWLNPNCKFDTNAPAVFADRDGTLIRHVDYLGNPKQVSLLSGVRDAVHSLLNHGCPLYLFTNQSGVGRGYYDLQAVFRCNERMFDLAGIRAEELAGICIATGLPDSGDPYRKPSPRFITEALDYHALSTQQAHMIGDSKVDVEVAQNAGVHAWLVANGKPQTVKAHKRGELSGNYKFEPDFPTCVRLILS